MGKRKRRLMLVVMVVFLTCSVLQVEAFARAGFGRSSGYRSSRSYSSPARSYSSPYSRPARPNNTPYQQSNRGGIMGGLLGGLAGGVLGGMLFRGLGFGGAGGGGLLQIIIFAGIAYFGYKMFIKRKNEGGFANSGNMFNPTIVPPQTYQNDDPQVIEAGNELAVSMVDIRKMDASFDEARFSDQVMDMFFKIQGSWMNRDLTPVKVLLTDEMYRFLQEDVDTLIREKKVNHLENIAVRKVEIENAWQEMGQDNITALIYANLLDYTTDETTGAVIAGSKSDPIKFEEYWSFIRPVGNNPWRLTGIDQK
ncbi:MAG TPA: Tim44 domain-containing protein [Candidatus Margulisbacteria bacterium]|nr:Tim44 domain-containing protein [Candidatus Margulisiibacteriota bacterium]